jgi:hypothetical protein
MQTGGVFLGLETIGIAEPEQLQLLSEALEHYCRTAKIDKGTVEHENAAALFISLLATGAATVDELIQAARDAFGPALGIRV